MRLHRRYPETVRESELVARFGQARLVRHLDRTCELIGGSDADRTEAKEWISLFAHNILLRSPPRAKIAAVAQPDLVHHRISG